MAQPILEAQVGTYTTRGGDAIFRLNVLLQTWLLGKTRTGKSTLMEDSIAEAIRAGYGCGIIEPHGPLADGVLSRIPRDRLKDVVYFNPASGRTLGVGFFDGLDKELDIQHFMNLMEIYSGPRGWGPQSADWFLTAADAVCEAFGRPTMLEISKFFNDDRFARSLMRKSKLLSVRKFYDFWYSRDVPARMRLEALSHPKNKVSAFMRPYVREVVCQKSSLDWAKMMDERKIVIVRLAKHEIGSKPAKIIGNLCLNNIILGAPTRQHPEIPWPVFVDEIHNFLDGIDFENALAELGKTGVTFFFATQTTAQMRDEERHIKNDEIAAGNCSTIISFRVSGHDSEVIALNAADENGAPVLVKLPNYQFHAWTLRGTVPSWKGPISTFSGRPRYGDEVPFSEALAWAKANSGTDKAVIEEDIEERLRK